MKLTEPIRNRQQVREIIDYYLKRGQIRNHVLIVMGIFTALRISDILRLCWDDVYDFKHNRVRIKVTITEKKTGKTKIIALNAEIITALNRFINEARPGAFLFENKQTGKAISRVQAYRLIRAAGEAVQIEPSVACHSLRKTYGYHSWKRGVKIEVLMKVYNHSSPAVTLRYIGVTQDDVDEAHLGLAF